MATPSPAEPDRRGLPRTAAWLQRLGGQARSLFRKLHRAVVADAAENPTAAGPDSRRYFDPEILARVGFSPLLARVVVEGFLNGLHQSPYHGFSVEFADHRDYVPGDDLKYLDWALYARTDHFYVKRFEEETNLCCYLLVDRSASMAYGTGSITKWDYACFLATCLAYLVLRQQDAAGLALFGARPGLFVPPRGRRGHLRQLMSVLANNPPAGVTDIAASLRAAVRNLKRRGLVVVLSDLIDEPEDTLKALRLLAGHRHDVIVFHVRDAAEVDFDFRGPALFRDMETGEELEINPAALRKSYLKQMEQLGEFYRKGLAQAGIDYRPLDTRLPYDRALSAYLARRAATRK
jgi:uncharacterized protein (DUF58 family)